MKTVTQRRIQEFNLGSTVTWASAKAHCESVTNRKLAAGREICSSCAGLFYFEAFDKFNGNIWVPVGDSENEWIRAGSSNLCNSHSVSVKGLCRNEGHKKPSWGTSGTGSYKGRVFCTAPLEAAAVATEATSMSPAKCVALCFITFGARALQLQGPSPGTSVSTCAAQLETIKANDKEAAAKCAAVVQLAKDVKTELAKRGGKGSHALIKKSPQWPHVTDWPEDECKQYAEILKQLDEQKTHCDSRAGGCQFDLEGAIKDFQRIKKEEGC